MTLVLGHGPSVSPLCFVGEAPGLNESLYLRPFVGEAGDELTRMMSDAGISRNDCYLTNVFKVRPPDNNVGHFFAKRSDDPTVCSDLSPYKLGQYLKAEFRPMFDNLIGELVDRRASVVVALGATALWALLGQTKISSFVGAASEPTPTRPFYVVPTYHPAAVLRQWGWRSTVVANLRKAADLVAQQPGRHFRASSAEQFNIKINPQLQEVEAFAEQAFMAPQMAVDIETAHGQIRTIAFSLDEQSAFVIPFWEPPGPSYWSSLDREVRAWKAVQRALSGRGTKIFHNAAFDLQYLLRVHGIVCHGPIEDTMVAYHSLEPELPKGLGDLAALLLHMPAWKAEHQLGDKDQD